MHLGDVAGRVEIVALGQRPAQPLSERAGDGALAAAGHAHDDEYASGRHSAIRCCIPSGPATKASLAMPMNRPTSTTPVIILISRSSAAGLPTGSRSRSAM